VTAGDDVRRRERAFYDRKAAERTPAEPPRPPDDYDRSLIAALQPLEGRRVLELGCGRGDLTLQLLDAGAEVTAVDVSPAMVDLARARAGGARFLVAPVEETGFGSDYFDRVTGKWILHHADVSAAAREIARVLKPDGHAAFFENQGRNPLLRLARRVLWRLPAGEVVGTPDERPLGEADIAALVEAFGSIELSYPSFYFFEAVSRAFRHRAHAQLSGLDRLVWRRLPRARPCGYHVLIRVPAREQG
jgi:SAM-dependent methyltransferase